MASYSIEHAKSGRSSCKKCKGKIQKDEIRIGSSVVDENRGYSMSSWYHPACFNLPKKYATGAEKISEEQFLEDVIEDEEGILSEEGKKEEIAAQIATKAERKKKDDGDGSDDRFIGKLKAEFDALTESGGKNDNKRKSSNGASGEPSAKRAKQLDVYGEVHKYNNEELKNELRWNKQIMTGNKDLLLTKVIDGRINGRLALCVCGGQLKLHESGTKVICNGTFDEDAQRKITCSLEYTPEKAARWHPWYTHEPTEEETEEMKRILEEGKEGGEVKEEGDLGELMAKAKGLTIDTKNKAAIKATVAAFVSLLFEDGKLDLPDDEGTVRKTVGPMIVNNKDLSAPELVKLIANHYGYADVKKEKAAKKEETIKDMCAVPANAPLMIAFKELADLYFKEGNTNAGGSYNKVVAAIKDLPFEITKENAKSLGKSGKNKVNGIGKGSSDRMYEFLSTGTIQKLEEKRANNA